ncbi:MAG: sulfur oxidation c-type cytochrome SoxX [Casimicrobiaceae bacterium]
MRRRTGPYAVAAAALALVVGIARTVLADPSPVPPGAVIVAGDAIAAPLAPAGDAARGRALLVARESANCILCHAIPDPALRFAGDVGPSLAGIGRRLSVGALRLRVVDNSRVNPLSIMPSYYRTDDLDSVAPAYRGKTILSAQEVEDVVAYLSTLR